VVLAITTGIVLAGIVGGLLAVPIVALLNTAVRSLLSTDPDATYDALEVDDPAVPLYPAEADGPHPPHPADPHLDDTAQTHDRPE
jgi:hypothetical protein